MPSNPFDWGERCPAGFVIPDDPSSPLNDYIFGTSPCATGCRLPIFTGEQYSEADKITTNAATSGLVLIIALILLWKKTDTRPDKHFLILLFFTLSALTSFGMMLICFDKKPMESKFCLNNAIPLRQSDGFSLCVGQGMLVIFSSLAVCLAWLAQSIDLFLRVVRGCKSTSKYFWRYMVLVFLYPSIAVSVLAICGRFGYNRIDSYCTTVSGKTGDDINDLTVILYYCPVAIIAIAGTVFQMAALAKFCKVWLDPTKVSIMKRRRARRSSVSVGTLDHDASTRRTNVTSVATRVAPRVPFMGDFDFDVGCVGGGSAAAGAVRVPSRAIPIIVPVPAGLDNDDDFYDDEQDQDSHSNQGINPRRGFFFGIMISNRAIAPASRLGDTNNARLSSVASIASSTRMHDDHEHVPPPTSVTKKWLKNLEVTWSLFAFCFLFNFFCALLFLYQVNNFVYKLSGDDRNYHDWVHCVFHTFDGTNDNLWISTCGKQPELFLSENLTLYYAAQFILGGQSLIACVAYWRKFLVLFRCGREAPDREIIRILELRQSPRRRQQWKQEEDSM